MRFMLSLHLAALSVSIHARHVLKLFGNAGCACCRKDGDVYRSLLEVAQRSPFNDTEEGPAWKPVLESRLNPKLRGNSRL